MVERRTEASNGLVRFQFEANLEKNIFYTNILYIKELLNKKSYFILD